MRKWRKEINNMTTTNPNPLEESLVNTIICGDCRDRMKEHIPDESVDLIYLDPPFFSSKQYDLIWGDSRATIQSFEDAKFYKKVCGVCGNDWQRKPNGDYYERCYKYDCDAPLKDAKDIRMTDLEGYVGWLKERLLECHKVLKPTGSIYCHLDWHAVHYVKVAMDDIFGMKNFQSEIVWKRKNQSRDGSYGHNHDTILYYSKTDDYVFNTQTRVKIIDKPTIRNNRPCKTAPANGYSDDRQKQMLASNEAYTTKNGKVRQITYLGKDKSGKVVDIVPCDNVWMDIPNMMHTKKTERLGYPTQKPEALLERIIKTSSNKGDTVLDPFCGCGTTITVANRLERKWIGIDIEPLSCTVQQARMEKTFGKEFKIIDIGKRITEEKACAMTIEARDMDPYAFQDWVVEVIGGKNNPTKSGDRGIDGWIGNPFDNLEKGDIIQVKRSDNVDRNVVKLHAQNIRASGSNGGLIIAFGFAKTAAQEANEIRARDGIDIHLMTVKALLMQTGNLRSTGKQSTGTQATLTDGDRKND